MASPGGQMRFAKWASWPGPSSAPCSTISQKSGGSSKNWSTIWWKIVWIITLLLVWMLHIYIYTVYIISLSLLYIYIYSFSGFLFDASDDPSWQETLHFWIFQHPRPAGRWVCHSSRAWTTSKSSPFAIFWIGDFYFRMWLLWGKVMVEISWWSWTVARPRDSMFYGYGARVNGCKGCKWMACVAQFWDEFSIFGRFQVQFSCPVRRRSSSRAWQ